MLPDDDGNVVIVIGSSLLQCKLHLRRDRPLPFLLDVEPDFGLQFLLSFGVRG